MNKLILKLIAAGDYNLTRHAATRAIERNISDDDIKNCGLSGNVQNTPDNKLRVVGKDRENDDLVLICVYKDGVLIITLF